MESYKMGFRLTQRLEPVAADGIIIGRNAYSAIQAEKPSGRGMKFGLVLRADGHNFEFHRGARSMRIC